MKYLITSSLMMVLFLVGCSENIETITIKDREMAHTLLIQKLENQSASEEMTKIIKDKQKIEDVLAMVEGLKVVEVDKEDVLDMLKSEDYYVFGFSEKKVFETNGKPVPYSFYFFTDGTIASAYDGFHSIGVMRMTKEKHPELLEEITDTLDIDF